MTVFTKNGVDIFSSTDAAGQMRQVVNGEVQVWSTEVEHVVNSFVSGATGTVRTSLASLQANIAYPAATMAWVIGDPVAANNGVYQKSGASGAGAWVKVGELPYSFIKATNAGAGTANAIVATTTVAINEAQLILLPIVAENPGSPVTVDFNGDGPLTVKTVSGNNVTTGGLPAGSVMLGIVEGGDFRLLSDQASASIQAAAEAAQAAAESARDTAIAAAAAVINLTSPPFNAIADGDGAGGGTDNSAAIAAALAYSAANNVLIGVPRGSIFRCDTALSYAGSGVFGFTGGGKIDFTNCATTTPISVTGPAWGAAHSLTANSVHPARTVTVSTGDAANYAAGDVIRVSSTKPWSADGATHSEFRVVSAVDTGTGVISLTESLCGHYLTADSAQIQKVDTACQPVFDIEIQGDPSHLVEHRGIVCDRVAFGFFKVVARDMFERSLQVTNSLWCRGQDLTFFDSGKDGLGYGFVDGGNQWCQWGDLIGHNCRHVYTGGDSSAGQIGREIQIGDVLSHGGIDSPVDWHGGCTDITIGNITGSMRAGNGSDYGITIQGDRITTGMININGTEQKGFFWQFLGGDPDRSHWINIGGYVSSEGPTTSSDYQIAIANSSGTLAQPIDHAHFGFVDVRGERGLIADCASGSILLVTIAGGRIVADNYHGIFISSSANGKAKVVCTGTYVDTLSANTAHYAAYANGAAYTAAFPGIVGAEIDLFGCRTKGGASTHMRAIDGRIELHGGSQSFSGGTKYLKSGIGVIKTPTLVDAA